MGVEVDQYNDLVDTVNRLVMPPLVYRSILASLLTVREMVIEEGGNDFILGEIEEALKWMKESQGYAGEPV